jgi:hypothetical protein
VAITRQRFARAGAFGGNVTANFGSNITAGRSLIIIAQSNPTAAPGTAGTVSGATRVAGGAVNTNYWYDVFLYNNHPGGTATVQYVPGEASDFTVINVWEVSVGAALELEVSPTGRFQSGAGTGTNAVASNSGSVSDGSIVVGMAASDNGANLSAGTNFSMGTNNGAAPAGGGSNPLQYNGAESLIQSGAATIAATFTAAANDNWLTVMAAFKETGGGGGGGNRRRRFLMAA